MKLERVKDINEVVEAVKNDEIDLQEVRDSDPRLKEVSDEELKQSILAGLTSDCMKCSVNQTEPDGTFPDHGCFVCGIRKNKK